MVNMSTTVSGWTIQKMKPERRSILLASKTIDEVSQHMRDFVNDNKDGSAASKGWAESSYGSSKIGVSLLTPILQKQLSADVARPDKIVNACCPGFVKTDMTENRGCKTIDEGADTPLYLSMLPPKTEHPKGEFVSRRKIIEWEKSKFIAS